jgi:Ribbon-helix-helix domain
MSTSGKTPKTREAEAFDFPLDTKRKIKAQRKEWVLGNSEILCAEFQRLRDKIDWDALRQSSTEDDVNAALSKVDQYARARFPNVAAILATVRDPNYPKLRPIRFLAQSCALTWTYPNSGGLYSPRYSRDICYKERKRRGPPPKPITNPEYWLDQAKLGQKVPRKYLGRINKLLAEEKARPKAQKGRTELTYVDIPEKIDDMKKKKRTTVWLPEMTVAKLKQLSAATGAPMAELFRRAVEAYLKTS